MNIVWAVILFLSTKGVDTTLQHQVVSALVKSAVVSAPRGYRGKNRDFNRHHLKAARCWAKNNPLHLPAESLLELETHIGLQNLSDNQYFILASMSHSRPVLAPPAQQMLNEIGMLFQKKLRAQGLPPYRFILTSGTRSRASQASLEKVNSNAASTTAHWFGYTFDIAYNEFVKPHFWASDVDGALLKKTLDETLRTMRKQKKLWVLGERRQACFHITVFCK